MKESYAFSVAVPREGRHIEVVEWGGFRVRTLGPLFSVQGPFRIGPHDNYTGLTDCDGHVQIVHLQAGESMDREAREIHALLKGNRSWA
jgi:hypothetical protein